MSKTPKLLDSSSYIPTHMTICLSGTKFQKNLAGPLKGQCDVESILWHNWTKWFVCSGCGKFIHGRSCPSKWQCCRKRPGPRLCKAWTRSINQNYKNLKQFIRPLPSYFNSLQSNEQKQNKLSNVHTRLSMKKSGMKNYQNKTGQILKIVRIWTRWWKYSPKNWKRSSMICNV